MATSYKILGQSRPSSTTDSDLYTGPASSQAVISTIAVSNTTSSNDSYRIYVRKSGASAAEANALVYDATSQANTTTTLTLGITVKETDVITVRSTNGRLTFHAFGSEIL
jgi:hypothetical protein